MKKFCIIANRDKDEDLNLTNQIIDFLTQNQCQVVIANESADSAHYTDINSIPLDTECVIVLGGDGTILHASHDLLNSNIPVLGINLGTLGFLAEIELLNVNQALMNLIQEDYRLEERMMLEARFQSEEQEATFPGSNAALNDIVITRSGFSRIICVGIYVNGAWVQDYRGDGVIISTPTGSTGYNLSAGGPIVTPKTEMMIITPICPHSLNARSIVVSASDTVEVVIRESKKTQEEEAIATLDGDRAVKLSARDRIIIRKSESKAKLIRFDRNCFFDLLRSKFSDEEYN
jgi:NAD+ kinase